MPRAIKSKKAIRVKRVVGFIDREVYGEWARKRVGEKARKREGEWENERMKEWRMEDGRRKTEDGGWKNRVWILWVSPHPKRYGEHRENQPSRILPFSLLRSPILSFYILHSAFFHSPFSILAT
jgi:hypothetical protein